MRAHIDPFWVGKAQGGFHDDALEDRDFVRGADRRDGGRQRVPLHPRQSRMRRSRGSGEPSRSSCLEHAGRTFKPDATLAIFHGRHYSRVEVHAEQPRPPAGATRLTASADQLRAVWGPFVAEAGTFEVSGTDVITMQRDGREESRGDAKRRVERLHLPASRATRSDADPGPHARRSECAIRSRSS